MIAKCNLNSYSSEFFRRPDTIPMNSVPLFKYYRRATLWPLAGTIIGGIILVIQYDETKSQTDILSDNNFGQFTFLIVLFSISICILKTTIFLSRYKAVTNNWFFNLLTWMLLPVSFLAVMLYKQVNFLMEYLYDGWEHPPYETDLQIMFVFVCVAHILFNLITFFQFRRRLAQQPAEPVQEIPATHAQVTNHHSQLTHHR
jgi:cobalamin synthase